MREAQETYTSPMLSRFGKYKVILSTDPEHVSHIPDGNAIPYAIWDERSRLNGVNVCSRQGMVYHVPDAFLSEEQKRFLQQNRDADGRLGTLTVVVALFLPENVADRLFPDPDQSALHSDEYSQAIQRCQSDKGRRSKSQLKPFPVTDILDSL